jgi:photosystem II stability/assembly factor-like uncharacterized protein
VVNDSVAWASGSGGIFFKTIDGETWHSDTIPGATQFDFRDIHAFSADVAYVLSAGEIAKIYKTTNGGASWTEQYDDRREGVFFDGFDFWNESEGIAYSDPIEGKLLIIKTEDGGQSWKEIEQDVLPETLAGEAGFAASGTGIVALGSYIWIATGNGQAARVFRSIDKGNSWAVFDTPVKTGDGCGIFSMTFLNENNGVIVGGCYLDSTSTMQNCAVTQDGGQTWEPIDRNQPNGYRSCVTKSRDNQLLISVGRTGCDFSKNGGEKWKAITKEGYFSCALGDHVGWAVGRNGKIAKIKF